MVRGDVGGVGFERRHFARSLRVAGDYWARDERWCARQWASRRHSGGRGWGRSSRRRGRNGNCRARKRQRDDWDIRCGICGDERSGSRAEGKNSHVLSRDSRALARDGRDARGGIVFALVSRSICGQCLLRFVDDRSSSRAGGVGWVALSLRDTFTIFRELGVPVKSIRLGGGGARSYLWQQIQADIYGMPVDLVA